MIQWDLLGLGKGFREMIIRPATLRDAEDVVDIYNHYILNTVITFEEQSVSPEDLSKRIQKVFSENLPWLVAEQDGKIVGYAYASQWKDRSAYRFSVECTIYLTPSLQSQGLGTKLYTALFETLRCRTVHAVVGTIALPNPASIALHEKFGMKKVAHFKEVGFKFNKWVDVGYWEVLL
ncbi:arsinothricin resistance N-acetyltransferase ArsN1 family B [Thermodesulfobacteriota bacterium]